MNRRTRALQFKPDVKRKIIAASFARLDST